MGKLALRIGAGIECNNKVFFSAIQFNGLFQTDLLTGRTNFLKRFHKEDSCFAIHRMAFLYKNEAWFIPQNGKYISIVNLNTLDIQYLDIPFHKENENAIKNTNAMFYSGSMVAGRFLYLIPTNIDTILFVDMEKKRLFPYFDIINVSKEYFLFGKLVKRNLWMIPCMGERIIKLNLDSGETEDFAWKKEIGNFLGASVYWNEKLWMVPFCAEYILTIDLNNLKMEKIPLGKYFAEGNTYEDIIQLKNEIWFLPFRSTKMIRFSLDLYNFDEKYFDRNVLVDGKNGYRKIYSDNINIFMTNFANYLFIFDSRMNVLQKIKVEMSWRELAKDLEERESMNIWEIEEI